MPISGAIAIAPSPSTDPSQGQGIDAHSGLEQPQLCHADSVRRAVDTKVAAGRGLLQHRPELLALIRSELQKILRVRPLATYLLAVQSATSYTQRKKSLVQRFEAYAPALSEQREPRSSGEGSPRHTSQRQGTRVLTTLGDAARHEVGPSTPPAAAKGRASTLAVVSNSPHFATPTAYDEQWTQRWPREVVFVNIDQSCWLSSLLHSILRVRPLVTYLLESGSSYTMRKEALVERFEAYAPALCGKDACFKMLCVDAPPGRAALKTLPATEAF
ncbi:unnamed protein product [Vitrella brassicaformis CCMP3155]|uniref:Uncharacterized protein n=1 Tax=Vitrella brassicaformis (strain CCMP3155) TaxID=1169540 RepID=A0A0G4GGY5_VITBC|nr:unnamed protein product [Vitrella brassicaformis CCMP3155]|eukprot:CEM28868.1 unnamed protein product [Vitrella brassicaformis CCMP3155]